jgi:hypothetical protein
MRRHTLISCLTLAIVVSSAPIGHAQQPASVPPPPGWKACPRCQSERDRKEANARYKVEGRTFTPRDLTGVWGSQGVGSTFRNPPPFTPWGQERFNATLGDKNAAGEPILSKDTSGEGAGSLINCDPKGWPRLHTYNYGFEFTQLPNRTLQFFELTHTWRTIWTDGRTLPESTPQLHWMGWNVGRWEGNTFVVESTGYDDRSWLADIRPDGGFPHSDELRVVERWRRLNYGTLEVQITVIDPKTYTKPWVTEPAKINLSPGAELWEDFCVPSDYLEFNTQIHLPVATGEKR